MIEFIHDGVSIPTAPQVQDPDDITDWGCDWTDWLVDGEVILVSNWTLSTGLIATATTMADTTTSVFIAGGKTGSKYLVTNRVSTATRTEERSMYILCEQK